MQSITQYYIRRHGRQKLEDLRKQWFPQAFQPGTWKFTIVNFFYPIFFTLGIIFYYLHTEDMLFAASRFSKASILIACAIYRQNYDWNFLQSHFFVAVSQGVYVSTLYDLSYTILVDRDSNRWIPLACSCICIWCMSIVIFTRRTPLLIVGIGHMIVAAIVMLAPSASNLLHQELTNLLRNTGNEHYQQALNVVSMKSDFDENYNWLYLIVTGCILVHHGWWITTMAWIVDNQEPISILSLPVSLFRLAWFICRNIYQKTIGKVFDFFTEKSSKKEKNRKLIVKRLQERRQSQEQQEEETPEEAQRLPEQKPRPVQHRLFRKEQRQPQATQLLMEQTRYLKQKHAQLKSQLEQHQKQDPQEETALRLSKFQKVIDELRQRQAGSSRAVEAESHSNVQTNPISEHERDFGRKELETKGLKRSSSKKTPPRSVKTRKASKK